MSSTPTEHTLTETISPLWPSPRIHTSVSMPFCSGVSQVRLAPLGNMLEMHILRFPHRLQESEILGLELSNLFLTRPPDDSEACQNLGTSRLGGFKDVTRPHWCGKIWGWSAAELLRRTVTLSGRCELEQNHFSFSVSLCSSFLTLGIRQWDWSAFPVEGPTK